MFMMTGDGLEIKAVTGLWSLIVPKCSFTSISRKRGCRSKLGGAKDVLYGKDQGREEEEQDLKKGRQ